MDSYLSNGPLNIAQLKYELKRKLVDFFSEYKGSKVGVFLFCFLIFLNDFKFKQFN